MKNKTLVFGVVFVISILAFYACESDDLCENAVVTPSLVARTVRGTSSEITPVSNLLIYGEGKNQPLSFATADSIVLPLKIKSNSTTYIMVKDAVLNTSTGGLTSGTVATVTFNYETEEQFVSKSCGFKVIFKNLSATVQNPSISWITNVNIINTSVENESNAKVYIHH